MKRIVVIIPMLICFVPCHAQFNISSSQTTYVATFKDWPTDKPELIRSAKIRTDSIYYYAKEKSDDGSLTSVQNFDSLGNLTESEDFSRNMKGNIWRIVNLSYIDNQLFKKETTTQFKMVGTNLGISLATNVLRYEKDIDTYEYDSTGKIISQKNYNYSGDSLNKLRLTTYSYEYDSIGRNSRTFVAPEGKSMYMALEYKYDGGNLSQKTYYDTNGILSYSLLFRFNNKKNIESIYENEESLDNLREKFFYDDQKRIIKEEYYTSEEIKFATRSFTYSPDDLIDRQNIEYVNNLGNSYYQHFYSRQ